MPNIFTSALVLALASSLHTSVANAKVPYQCQDPHPTVHLVNQDPLVMYIANFLTDDEIKHVQKISSGNFKRSRTANSDGVETNRTSRTSKSQPLASDPIVQCIENRAAAFQGFDVQRSQLEPIQLVHYDIGENYNTHTDWFESDVQTSSDFGGNRMSSFFAYVTAKDITGGGTNFPVLDAPKDERWCQFVNCYEPWEAGVTFRPIPGNAVFWKNLDKDGIGQRSTVHAGLPPTSGEKLGMNIWTRERPMNPKIRTLDNEAAAQQMLS